MNDAPMIHKVIYYKEKENTMRSAPDPMLVFFTVFCGSFAITMGGAFAGIFVGSIFGPIAGVSLAVVLIVGLHWIMIKKSGVWG